MLLTFSLCSDCVGSFSFPSDFFVCLPSLLLVMVIASRPPTDCDPFPVGWLWSCLPKEMSRGVYVCVRMPACVYSVLIQCVEIFNDAAHMYLSVIMCLCRLNSQFSKLSKWRKNIFHLNAVIYRLFSLLFILFLILLAKQNLWGGKGDFLHNLVLLSELHLMTLERQLTRAYNGKDYDKVPTFQCYLKTPSFSNYEV